MFAVAQALRVAVEKPQVMERLGDSGQIGRGVSLGQLAIRVQCFLVHRLSFGGAQLNF
jgi:hypothetical protein